MTDFDLINRQKAEIESLESDLKTAGATILNLYSAMVNIKAEAVKDFAERLEAKYRCYDLITPLAAIIEVGNTKREMLGNKENIVLPDTIKSIDASVFDGCSKMDGEDGAR